MAGKLIRTVQWLASDPFGPDRCTLSEISYGWELKGEANGIGLGPEGPQRVLYTVRVDHSWKTRYARVQLDREAGPGWQSSKRCSLKRDDLGFWTPSTGPSCPPRGRIQGLIDIDIQATPATNTLPIRRLNLAVGESAEVTAAWFRLPEFQLEPLRQRYTRVSEDTYHYEAPDHEFTATLTVDDLGLVVDYDPGWQRMFSIDG
ncbi:MAG: putative glycolipid-binding domain-containing protein [Thermomicrobiales bacterium]